MAKWEPNDDEFGKFTHPQPSPTLNSLKNLSEVVVKGNLTSTPYLIENAEIYPLNISLILQKPCPLYKKIMICFNT